MGLIEQSLGPETILINHTHPDGSMWPSSSDMKLLENLKTWLTPKCVGNYSYRKRKYSAFWCKWSKGVVGDVVMDINKYSYLWENHDNVLVKTTMGYSIVNKRELTMFCLENEKIEEEIIKKMLQNGNPIYASIKDLKDNGSPMNIVGLLWKAEEFPVKRYKISIKWSENVPLIIQIKNLKNVFPVVKVKSNQELLEIAKTYDTWQFDIAYLDLAGKNELLKRGKEKQLAIIIEPDDLKDSF